MEAGKKQNKNILQELSLLFLLPEHYVQSQLRLCVSN